VTVSGSPPPPPPPSGCTSPGSSRPCIVAPGPPSPPATVDRRGGPGSGL
jgi:hypothetical protein